MRERIKISHLTFDKISINSVLAFDKRPRILKEPVFQKLNVEIRINFDKAINLLMNNTGIAGSFLPDIGDFIFGEPFENTGLAGSRYVGEPFIILTNEDLWYVVAEISKEIYRECRGGFPKPYIITKKEELENLVSLGEKLNDRIIIIKHALDVFEKKEELMFKIVQEMFSEGLGFLVLVAKNKEEERRLMDLFSRDYITLLS